MTPRYASWGLLFKMTGAEVGGRGEVEGGRGGGGGGEGAGGAGDGDGDLLRLREPASICLSSSLWRLASNSSRSSGEKVRRLTSLTEL